MASKDLHTDRRRHRRTSSHRNAVVRCAGKVARCTVRNLSQSGALLTDIAALPIATELMLVIQLPAQPPVRVRARVVHHVDLLDGDMGTGIAFLPENQLGNEQLQATLAAELERRSSAAVDFERRSA